MKVPFNPLTNMSLITIEVIQGISGSNGLLRFLTLHPTSSVVLIKSPNDITTTIQSPSQSPAASAITAMLQPEAADHNFLLAVIAYI
jgi:hypothetical protein